MMKGGAQARGEGGIELTIRARTLLSAQPGRPCTPTTISSDLPAPLIFLTSVVRPPSLGCLSDLARRSAVPARHWPSALPSVGPARSLGRLQGGQGDGQEGRNRFAELARHQRVQEVDRVVRVP